MPIGSDTLRGMRIALCGLLSFALVGCITTVSPAPGSQTTAGDGAALSPSQRLVNKVEMLATDVGRAGADCGVLATTLGGWVDTEGASVQNLSREAGQTPMGADETASLDARLTDAFERVVRSASQCQGHTDAQTAFARFDQLIESI